VMDHDRYCTEILTQTDLLATGLKDADLRSRVPSCPDWSLGMLVRHIGHGQRWAEQTVRTRSASFLPDDDMRLLVGDDTGEFPADWLLAGAGELSATLRAAGPDASLWTPLDLHGTASFWARRFTHETLIHRADATLAAGREFRVSPDVALDAVDEWMWLHALPQHFEYKPQKRELFGPGRTLGFEATDTPDGDPDAAWFVDLTGDVIRWQRGRRTAAVTVRAPLTDLLLAVYTRTSFDDPVVQVSGDRGLLDLWNRHAAFG
jgi:uncharacterized protein (TIGR03083 family)